MNSNELGGIVRAVVAGVGGYLVGKGYVDQATVEQVAGALGVLAVAVWSVVQKRRAASR